MNMYQAILKRKSIRNYDMNPLDDDTIKNIEEYIQTIKSYNSEIKTKINIVNDEKQVAGMFKVKAPHYVVITSEKKEDYLINVGYVLEQIVIYLTSKGLGTCYLGSTKPTKEILENNSLDFIVMLAIGKPNELLYRENVSQFKRKSISEISNLTETNNIMEAVRLSPSAVNQQAWYFEVSENEIAVYRKEVLIMMERMSKIDIGIALSHIYIAAEDQSKSVELVKEKNKDKRGYEYIITCKII